MTTANKLEYFRTFKGKVDQNDLPTRFQFPFYYQPHPIALQAAAELQAELTSWKELDHNFGLEEKEGLVIGKMFGVLVVQQPNGDLGYLAAFSGKLANSNQHAGFVPPVFDMLEENSFFKQEEHEFLALTEEIESFSIIEEWQKLKEQFKSVSQEAEETVNGQKEIIKTGRAQRDSLRKKIEESALSTEEKTQQIAQLAQQSMEEKLLLKNMQRHFEHRLKPLREQLKSFEDRLDEMIEFRKNKSNELQQKLFNAYQFINAKGEWTAIKNLFTHQEDGNPPSGAGECAAPKLLQYAFLNDLKPIALCEFWWGASPKSEVRVHQQTYPACRGKCEPILGFMLQGMDVVENPLLQSPSDPKELEILYQDDDLVVINKPHDFLSVPGKNISDSVYTRALSLFPEATGPIIVHRLDMSTSGCLVLALNKEAHFSLQRQFTKRTVKKEYEAILSGVLTSERGSIDLPLRVDLDDRPRQLVCYEHGSPALTHYERIEVKKRETRIRFFPHTGRTHQLRVHSAHALGLNIPIKGDDLYGTPADRLHLHAAKITFLQPTTKEELTIVAPTPF